MLIINQYSQNIDSNIDNDINSNSDSNSNINSECYHAINCNIHINANDLSIFTEYLQ